MSDARRRLSVKEAVELLDKERGRDPEGAHAEADDILLAVVDPAVRDAYERLVKRAGWWGCG